MISAGIVRNGLQRNIEVAYVDERAAGGGQTGGNDETTSATNDATATAVEQTPLSGMPTATPAQVTNKRHKSTARLRAATLRRVPCDANTTPRARKLGS